MQEQDAPDGQRLLAWALGSFHTALFMTVIVFVLLREGALGGALGSLNTIFGLLLYAGLWSATCYSTWTAVYDFGVRRLIDQDVADWTMPFIGAAMLGGTKNGALIFAVLAVPTFVVLGIGALANQGPQVIPGLLVAIVFVGGIGACVVGTIGCLVGFVMALIDGTILQLACWLTKPYLRRSAHVLR